MAVRFGLPVGVTRLVSPSGGRDGRGHQGKPVPPLVEGLPMTGSAPRFPRPLGSAVRAGCALVLACWCRSASCSPVLATGERPAHRDPAGAPGRGVSAQPCGRSRSPSPTPRRRRWPAGRWTRTRWPRRCSQVAAVDDRYGDALRTTSGGPASRAKMDTMRSDAGRGDRATALAAYREVGDLLLGLYAKVRDESGLVHDPDADAFHLQEQRRRRAADRGRRGRPAGRQPVCARGLAGRPRRPADPQPQPSCRRLAAPSRADLPARAAALVDGLRSAWTAPRAARWAATC